VKSRKFRRAAFDLQIAEIGVDAGHHVVTGTVGFSSLPYRLHAHAGSEGLYVIAIADGRQFFARVAPRLFDHARQPMAMQHIARGSRVKLHIDDDGWMDAIQAMELIDDCPF
jgi:hypothetical protein